MGYPMTWLRVNLRNLQNCTNYDGTLLGAVKGDANRLEHDTQDNEHIAAYAAVSGATTEQVKVIFKEFFTQTGPFNGILSRKNHKEK